MTSWRGEKLADFRTWLSRNWFEIVGSGDEKHLRAGTNCEPLEAWRKVVSYAAKYLGKSCVFEAAEGSTQKVGRFWGVWRRELLPIRWKRRLVRHRAWAQIRRTVRRMLRSQGIKHAGHVGGRDRSTTVFLSGDSIRRVLDWAIAEHESPATKFTSTARMIFELKLKQTVNRWFAAGEAERQERHREDQIIGRFNPPWHHRDRREVPRD